MASIKQQEVPSQPMMRLPVLEEEVAGGELSGTGQDKPVQLNINESAALQAAYCFTGLTAYASGATMQQCFLQGTISGDRDHEALSVRLRGIANDYAPFTEFEISLRLSHNPPINPQQQQPVLRYPPVGMRIRRSLSVPKSRPSIRYLGTVDSDKNIMRRNCIEAPVHGPALEFLTDLGFEKEFAFVMEGHIYIRGKAKCLVYRVCDIQQYTHEVLNPDSMKELVPKEWRPMNPNTWMVEVSTVGSAVDESFAQEVIEFADMLKPIAQLQVVDYAKFNA